MTVFPLTSQAATKRRTIFLKFNVPLYQIISEGGISGVYPLSVGRYGFIYTEKCIMLGQGRLSFMSIGTFVTKSIIIVRAIFAKSGGKNGKHGATEAVTNVSAASRIAVQVFEYTRGTVFRQIPSFTLPFNAKGYLHIEAHHFLLMLSQQVATDQQGVRIGKDDLASFRALEAGHNQLVNVAKEYRKRKPSTTTTMEE
jgi:hypothetical protein